MPISTTTIHTTRTAPAPLMLRDRARARRRGLASAQAGPVMREASGAGRRAAELQAVPRRTVGPALCGDRVLDTVADRLLRDLGL